MIVPIVTVDGIDGRKVVLYVKYNELKRNTILIEVGEEKPVEISMKDALHIANIIRLEYEFSHYKLKSEILGHILGEVSKDEKDRSYG